MNLYFDNASSSFPKSPTVSGAVVAYVDGYGGSAGMGSYGRKVIGAQIMERCRDAVAGVLGVEVAEHVFFTGGATMASNCVIRGGAVVAGTRVLTSPMEHNAVARPLYAMGVKCEVLPFLPDGSIDPDHLQEVDCKGVSLVAINHVSNVTGVVQPVEQICRWAHAHHVPVMVDTSQSAGQIAILGDRWQVDYLIFTGHKGLGGVSGIGGFYAKNPQSLTPLIYGGTGAHSQSATMPKQYPERFEAGTPNIVGAAALLAAIQSPLKRAHSAQHYSDLLTKIHAINGIKIYSGSPHIELFSITHNRIGSAALCEQLYRQSGIETRSGLHCAPMAHQTLGTLSSGGTLRISLSATHTTGEIDTLYNSLASLCR